MFSDGKNYTLGKIASAQLATTPFPHLVIDQVFSPEIYEALQRNLPDNKHFRTLADTERVSKNYNRSRLCLMPDELIALEKQQPHPSSDNAPPAL
ncbi:MAG: hypothetical protein KDE14_15570, partial [Rhodobacteraceae bacterium]|nr:hypothetical protein [Paracoccaceae bacterium]